jgi:prepilin-type N-terminal cleavage/methylation domain-containing protein
MSAFESRPGTTSGEIAPVWWQRKTRAKEGGFTLVELLLTLVVIGVLTAVAIVGINGVTAKGGESACKATMDSAEAASAAYYTHWHTYPQTFPALTNPPNPFLETHGLVTAATTLEGHGGWILTLQPGPTASDRTTFTGC